MPIPLTLAPGRVFGKLTLVDRQRHPVWNKPVWRCRCECGRYQLADTGHLNQGRTTQCRECRRAERQARATKHGLSKSPEYRIWAAARDRCTNPNVREFKNYGGRGITMCAEWAASFVAFHRDMGLRPSKGHSLERRDNGGPYAPANCEWATKAVQSRNKRNNHWLTHRGVTLTHKDWARRIGLSNQGLRSRLCTMSVEQALSRPKKGAHL